MRFRGEDSESQVQPGLTARLRPVLIAHQDPVSKRRDEDGEEGGRGEAGDYKEAMEQ